MWVDQLLKRGALTPKDEEKMKNICQTCNGNGYVLRDGEIEQCSTCDSEGETYVQENSAPVEQDLGE